MNTLRKILLAGLVSTGLAVSAHATAVLELWVDNNPAIFIYDGQTTLGLVDNNSNASSIAWSGSIGGWNVTVAAGLTVFGGTAPAVDLVALVTGSGGTLHMFYGDNGFGPAVASNLTGHIGGTTNGATNVFFGGAYNQNNVSEYGYYAASTNVTGSPFSAVIGGGIPDSLLYSLQVQVEVTHTANATTSFDAYVSVPDGASTALLVGLGLVGMSLVSRRRK